MPSVPDLNILPKRVELNGADCFHLVLDRMSEQNRTGDNVMRKIFFFEEHLRVEHIQTQIDKSSLIYWLGNIVLKKGIGLEVPYWEFRDLGNRIQVNTMRHDVKGAIPDSVLHRDIPLNGSRFVEFDLITYPDLSTALVLSWNHILLDGKGSTLLINHLNDLARGLPENTESFFPKPVKSRPILEYIRNMYRVKNFIERSSRAPIASVASGSSKSKNPFRYLILPFTEEETLSIGNRAFAAGARFGTNSFHIACCAHTVHELNRRRGKGGTMWFPIPYDGRKRGSKKPVISNNVNYVFYRFPADQLTSVESIVSSMNGQMSDQLKINMPAHYMTLLEMMRQIPLSIYYRLIRKTGEGEFASFLYSSTGENFNGLKEFMGVPIQDMSILPSATFPPGLTFIFLNHLGKLRINIGYSPDVISTEELNWVADQVRTKLLYT